MRHASLLLVLCLVSNQPRVQESVCALGAVLWRGVLPGRVADARHAGHADHACRGDGRHGLGIVSCAAGDGAGGESQASGCGRYHRGAWRGRRPAPAGRRICSRRSWAMGMKARPPRPAPRAPAPAQPALAPPRAACQAALPGSRGAADLRQRGMLLARAQQLGVGSEAPGSWPHKARDWRGGRWTGSARYWRRPHAGALTRARWQRWRRRSPRWRLGSCSRSYATCARGWCPARSRRRPRWRSAWCR